MQASNQDIVMQFTEDAFAWEDRVCQWSSCQVPIRKGDPCHYVAAYDPTQPGKFVCGACYRWYKNKPATTIQQAQNTNGAFPDLICQTQINISSVLPDPQAIRWCISAAQNKGKFISTLLWFLPHWHIHSFSQPSPCPGYVKRHTESWKFGSAHAPPQSAISPFQFCSGSSANVPWPPTIAPSSLTMCIVLGWPSCARSICLEPDPPVSATSSSRPCESSSTEFYWLQFTAPTVCSPTWTVGTHGLLSSSCWDNLFGNNCRVWNCRQEEECMNKYHWCKYSFTHVDCY